MRCYRYGKQSIPMDESVEKQFEPEKMRKGVEIMGTVGIHQVPFWLLTKEPTLFSAWPEVSKDEKAGIDAEEHKKLRKLCLHLPECSRANNCVHCVTRAGEKVAAFITVHLLREYFPKGIFSCFLRYRTLKIGEQTKYSESTT